MLENHKCLNCNCNLKEVGMYDSNYRKYNYEKGYNGYEHYCYNYNESVDPKFNTSTINDVMYCCNCYKAIGTTNAVENYYDISIIPF